MTFSSKGRASRPSDLPAAWRSMTTQPPLTSAVRLLCPGLSTRMRTGNFAPATSSSRTTGRSLANLAYGVTAGLDVQTSYKDYFAYRDFQQTGAIDRPAGVHDRTRGIFGNNDFQSYDATKSYLRRYTDHYHTKNIKSYVVGNRKQRQWIVLASRDARADADHRRRCRSEAGPDPRDRRHARQRTQSAGHPDLPTTSSQLYARKRRRPTRRP